MSASEETGHGSTANQAGELPAPNDAEQHESAPPWQRAASQQREGEHVQANEQNGYQRPDDQPTMIQPVVSDTGDRLFAPGGGSEGTANQRTPVNLTGSGGDRRGDHPRSATPSALRRPGRGPRRASLQIKRVDPWSVLKLSFVLSVAFFLVLLVAVGLLYIVLDGMGVWDKVNGTYSDLVSGTGGPSGSGDPLISAGRVFAVTAVIGVVNIILFTAISTVSAFVYNVAADLAGGLEVTLAERE